MVINGKPKLSLLGKRFGRLQVRSFAGTKAGRTLWECVCDCGSIVITVGTWMKRGHTRSCGCLAGELAGQRNAKPINPGTRFGRLTILCGIGSTESGKLIYACLCDCGVEVEVSGHDLRVGSTKSCGCLRKDTIGSLNRTHGLSGTKEYQAQASSKHRARAAKVEGMYSVKDIRGIFAEQKGLCFYCSATLGDQFHRDHKMPLSRGGSNYKENICLTCPLCNRKKSNKTAEEFFAILGRDCGG